MKGLSMRHTRVLLLLVTVLVVIRGAVLMEGEQPAEHDEHDEHDEQDPIHPHQHEQHEQHEQHDQHQHENLHHQHQHQHQHPHEHLIDHQHQHLLLQQDNNNNNNMESIVMDESEAVFHKATEIYESGVAKRKYRFWVEYGPDDDWSQRKEPQNVTAAISLLEEAGQMGLDDGYYTVGEIYEYGELGAPDLETARMYYEKAASTGNPSAQSALGFIYGTGKNVTINEPLAQLYTLFAARAGDTAAQMTMGYKYFYGYGTPKSCSKAAEWYEFAARQVLNDVEDGAGSITEQVRLSYEAESGHPIQQDEDVVQYFQYAASENSRYLVELGDLHLNGGLGVERDYAKAIDYYKQAADLKNAAGLSNLGYMYANGLGVEQNNKTALKFYQQAAEMGSPHAQTQLGIFYYHGWNVQKSYKEALKLFHKAYEQDYAPALVQLGHMHFYGHGVTANMQKAFEYYYAAATKKGNLAGMFHLAEMYLHGYAQTASCTTAVILFKKVAERGLWAELLTDAHNLYEEGDYETALLVYEHLAEMGYEVAQSNAAWMYDKGLGITVKSDAWPTRAYLEGQAFRYYLRAADQHNPEAHVALGDYYYYGKGTEVDYFKAANFYESAKKQPYPQQFHVVPVARALFNLGYMHEHGIGCEKDLFLAKRNYDEALATNEDAYLAVGLALIKLGFHFVHDFFTGELKINTLPALDRLRAVHWDNFFIVVLSMILGILIVIRQRRVMNPPPRQ